ncbi:MAG: hypothetical protein INR73_20110 [Williamsia sp.]|nr:hypothetical protein [Williamsia sp.]
MPVLNIAPRFVPFILDGSKTFALLERQISTPHPGDRLSLYSSLGTSQAQKLCTGICLEVCTYIITDRKLGICKHRIDELRYDMLMSSPAAMLSLLNDQGCQVLSARQRDQFAWKHGFRPPHSSQDEPGRGFDKMIGFWLLHYSLPFIGDLIRWEVLLQR